MKNKAIILLVMVSILSVSFSAYSMYIFFNYGNPKKMIETENMVMDYLKKEKGYNKEDIVAIKGKYNNKKGNGDKYEGYIYLKEYPNEEYEYTINNNLEVLEYDSIPEKR